MKKFMKLCKILLLIVTVFSYVSSPISVLADEIINSELKSLMLNLNVNSEGEGYVLNYISADPDDYEDTKNYKIELETSVTYTNGDEEILSENEIVVSGATLRDVRSSYILSDPVSEYYNGEYVLEVTVYDGGTEIYSEELEYETEYSAPVGLTGKLVGEYETLEEATVGNYNVTTEGKYTQSLYVLTGELSPIGNYRIVYGEGEEVTYSDVMTGNVLRTTELVGTETDLTGKLAGTYSYIDNVTIQEVEAVEGSDELTVVNTYNYSYNAKLNYGNDNDDLFTNVYQESGALFVDGYMVVSAKGLGTTETVLTIQELVDVLAEVEAEKVNKTVVEVLDETETALDLTDTDVLAREVKNGYVVNFTNGATASYFVVVVGDADLDNDFDIDDLVGVMEGYINEENMPSMDMFSSQGQQGTGPVVEEIGTITFEDVIVTNELLKGEDADFTDREIGNATVVFGELPELVYVGDTLEVQVFVSAESPEEFIDGIDGLVSYTNLKLDDVSYVGFNSLMTGVSNTEGRLVAVASAELPTDTVIMTLKFVATEEGTATISFSGYVSRFMSMNEFELTAEVEVDRNISSNNNLSSLKPSVGTFDVEFDKDVTVYTLTVPYNTEKVILSGALEDLYSTVDGLIEYELTEDKTTAIITVTAEDGSTKVYTVYIVKEAAPVTTPVTYYYSSNNYLKSLEVDGYEIEFDKNINEYKITVKNDITSLDIRALAEDIRSRVEITGNGEFKEGENTVTITVTAENGSTREYKLLVTREEKKAVTDTEESSNTAERIVIIVLIILVVLGLLYLIFKKDEDDTPVKREDPRTKNDNNNENNRSSNKKDNSGNKKNNNKKKK